MYKMILKINKKKYVCVMCEDDPGPWVHIALKMLY